MTYDYRKAFWEDVAIGFAVTAVLALVAILCGCDGRSPVEPSRIVATLDAPTTGWPTPAPGTLQRTPRQISAVVLNDATGLPVQRSILDVWDGSLTFRLYANDGTGTWAIPDGLWSVQIAKQGWVTFDTTIVVSAASTNFTFRVVQK